MQIPIKSLLVFIFLLCFSMFTNKLYAWNETDSLLIPEQYPLPPSEESNSPSSYYDDDEMPDMWQKPRDGFFRNVWGNSGHLALV